MLSMGRRQNRTATGQENSSTPLPPTDLMLKFPPVGQLSSPDVSIHTNEDTQSSSLISQLPFPPTSSNSTQIQSEPTITPELTDMVTLNLPAVQQERQTGALEPGAFVVEPDDSTYAARKRVVIHGSSRKGLSLRPPKATGRRTIVAVVVGVLLAFSVLTTLLAVAPTDGQPGLLEPFKSVLSAMSSKNNNNASISSVVATATAVTQDGYDVGGNKVYAGVASSTNNTSNVNAGPASSTGNVSAADAGSLNRFQDGQCTYWANMHYHALTGHWIPWLGNANAWAYQAGAYGWVVSKTPNPNGPSIIVLQSGVQGAGYFGHVAVVESINSDGSVVTSNWNWRSAWHITTYVTFRPGLGVTFIWHA